MLLEWKKFPCLDLLRHYYLSLALLQVGAYQEAEKEGLIALRIDSVRGGIFGPEIYSQLASIANDRKDFNKAVHYYRLGYNAVRNSVNPYSPLGALNNMGLMYIKLDSIELAETTFKSAYQSFKEKQLSPSTLLASLLDNLSDVALLKKDTLTAIHLLHQKDSLLNQINPDTLRKFETWAVLASLYVAIGEPGIAIGYLEKAEKILAKGKNFTADHAYNLEITRFDYSLAIDDSHGAIQAIKKIDALRDRSLQEMTSRHQIKIDVLHEVSNHSINQERMLAMAAIEKKEQESLYQKRIVLLLGILGLIVLLGLYIYFLLRSKLHKQRIAGLEVSVKLNAERLKSESLEKELLKQNLETSEKDLISIAMDNVRRKEWTRDILEKLDTVLDKSNGNQHESLKSVYHELFHQAQIQDRLSLSHENQEIIQAAFVNQLRIHYPELTTSEMDLCILIRLGLTGKEIAVVRNIDPESIRKAKYRLRQKMNLASPQELKVFLNSISKV